MLNGRFGCVLNIVILNPQKRTHFFVHSKCMIFNIRWYWKFPMGFLILLSVTWSISQFWVHKLHFLASTMARMSFIHSLVDHVVVIFLFLEKIIGQNSKPNSTLSCKHLCMEQYLRISYDYGTYMGRTDFLPSFSSSKFHPPAEWTTITWY